MKNFMIKVALFLLRKCTDSALIGYAECEFFRAGWCDANGKFEDEMQRRLCMNVTDMLRVMSAEGHSGFSAAYAANLFAKLGRFQPLSPLTGRDDEWMEVGEDVYQSKIYGAVFKKGKDGKPYWLDARVFVDESGCSFTSRYSRQFIEFPWEMPQPEYIHVTHDEGGNTVYPEHIKAIEV